MGVSLPLEKMSRQEKLQIMESLWDDLCGQAEQLQSPDWHRALLEERAGILREGGGELKDWDDAKKRIRNICE